MAVTIIFSGVQQRPLSPIFLERAGRFQSMRQETGVNGIAFSGAGYTISGPGTITLGASATLNGAANGQISAILAGGGTSVTKTSTNSITLTGVNTYTGSTVVLAGTCRSRGRGLFCLQRDQHLGGFAFYGWRCVLEHRGDHAVGWHDQSDRQRNDRFHLRHRWRTGLEWRRCDIDDRGCNVDLLRRCNLGCGCVDQAGSGTFTLTGANTYTGTTTVSAAPWR